MKSVRKVITDTFNKLFNDNTFIDEEHTEILKTVFVYLRFLNVWPKHGHKLRVYNMKAILFLLFPFTIISVFAEIVHILLVKRNYLLDDLLSGMTFMGTGISTYYLLISFIRHNEKNQQLVAALGDFTDYPKPRNLDKVNRRMDTMAHLFVIYSICGVSLFAFLAVLNRSACLKEAEELKLQKTCGMIFPGLYPESFNSDPYFYIGYINQLYTSISVCVIAFLISFVLIGSTEILITRIQHFKDTIKKAFLVQVEADRKKYLNYCIRYHCFIIDLSDRLNNNMISVAFVLASFSSGMVALIGFQYMMRPELKTLIHVLAWVMLLTMMSTSGQRLINESSEITDVIWATDWFEENIEAQKYVQMMIMRSQRYLSINSYFGEVSLEAFGSIMSGAYSILTLFAKSQRTE